MNLIYTKGFLNLATLNQKADEVIFDYIDSKPNWEKAFKYLDVLLEECTNFFLATVKKNNELPKGNTYWNLFLEINAKLIYFSTLALQHYNQKSIGITEDVLRKRYETSALCLTNVQTEEASNFLEEIKSSYESVGELDNFQGNRNLTVEERLQVLYEFSKQY